MQLLLLTLSIRVNWLIEMKWKTLIKSLIWVWCTYCFSTSRDCEMCSETLLRVTMVKFFIISDIEGPMARWRRSQNYSFVEFQVKRQVDVTSLAKLKMAETREQKRTTVNYGLLWFKPRYLENFELLWLKLWYYAKNYGTLIYYGKNYFGCFLFY